MAEPNDDELLKNLEAAERARRRKALISGAIVAGLAIVALLATVAYRTTLFQPRIDIKGGEKEVLADTNDPQCRQFIADVTALGLRYRALEPDLEKGLLGKDRAEIGKLIAQVDDLRDRLKKAHADSADANFRFDNSRKEVDDWFKYIQAELAVLDRVGNGQLAKLKPQLAQTNGATNPAVAGGTVVAEPKKKTPTLEKKKTPQELLDSATLDVTEAFQKFRVWHTGGLHPCGKAAPGEKPWTPPPHDKK